MMHLIELCNISKIYGKNNLCVKALKSINLGIDKGELVAVMGASGSGKSTLLNILGCIDRCTEGRYLLQGKEVSSIGNCELARLRNKHFGFVVQHFALIDDYTIFENVKIPLDYAKVSRKNKKEKVKNILTKMNIYEKVNNIPSELSGGQNQRVAIARALINDPEIILADEPTGALDKKTGESVMEIFLNLNKEGKTIIIVTHDEKIAKYCSRIILMEDGEIKDYNFKIKE